MAEAPLNNSTGAWNVFNATFNETFLPSISMPPSSFWDTVDSYVLRSPSSAPSASSAPSDFPLGTLKSESTPSIPTMSGLSFNLGVCFGVLVAVLFLFAIAMRCQSTNIAPRCAARPKNVIYNPDPQENAYQDKGNPFLLGWVAWVLNLSYQELLEGIPGTGTRDGGRKGRMLTLNLDHIVLLRFNALSLKISFVAMLTYSIICLPIYYSARCQYVPLQFKNTTEGGDALNCTSKAEYDTYDAFNYVRFTLENVPDLDDPFLSSRHHLEAFLLYMVSFASWIVVWYACFELFHEWIDQVVIRRVYYLEQNHWKKAQEELDNTMMEQVEEEQLLQRDIWLPHPEQRDNPSNIELYSVLVGGIPRKPNEGMKKPDLEEAVKTQDLSQVNWQMELVSTFFDSCVPNMPGFTSSVAAVTILPSATELAVAWRYWYGAAKKLSRLRFIRQRIRELGGTPAGQRLVLDVTERGHTTASERNLRFQSIRRQDYSAEVLGAGNQDDTNDQFWKSLDLGPEQIAVYNREFSQGLAGCCPHGCCEQRISYCKDLEVLLEMEAEAAEDVSEAYAELKQAGEEAALAHSKRKTWLDNPQTQTLNAATTEMRLMSRRLIKKKNKPDRNSAETPRQPTGNHDAQNSEEKPNSIAAAQLFNMSGGAEKEKDDWDAVKSLANEARNHKRRGTVTYTVQNGKWSRPTSVWDLFRVVQRKVKSLIKWTGDNSMENADFMAKDSTYAVVTFTSRQAAVAARQCLADGRGADAFTTATVLPVPPLADAAACNICDCRGCCKPVTIGLNERQKQWRQAIVLFAVGCIYVFYTIPITFTSELASQVVILLFPDIEQNFSLTKSKMEGLLEAGILSLFLSFLPDIFLFLANFGTKATSLVDAENNALSFYWYFMVCFAMVGASIVKMGLAVVETGSFDVKDTLETIARTIPVDVSSVWMNWTIQRAMVWTPAFYLLQLNSFLFGALGLECCVRMFRGGGSGSRLPYRIYVENGTVLLCSLALGPAAPILCPFAVMYFLVCTPLLRYVLIFTYKPVFDSGGSRWPALFDTYITSLVVAQVLLATMLSLKHAYGAAGFAAVPVVLVLMFRKRMRSRFLAAFNDAALLQTSSLDGWGVGSSKKHFGWREREEFRRFLVDTHKAAFVPICIATTQGGSKSKLTAEPAEVVWETEEERIDMLKAESADTGVVDGQGGSPKSEKRQQFGALHRRYISGRNLSVSNSDQPDLRGANLSPAPSKGDDVALPPVIREESETESLLPKKPDNDNNPRVAAEESSSVSSPTDDDTSLPVLVPKIEESLSEEEKSQIELSLERGGIKWTGIGSTADLENPTTGKKKDE